MTENLPLVKLLVEYGAPLHTDGLPYFEYNPDSAVWGASKVGNIPIMEYLLSKGGILDGSRTLHFAVENKRVEMVRVTLLHIVLIQYRLSSFLNTV